MTFPKRTMAVAALALGAFALFAPSVLAKPTQIRSEIAGALETLEREVSSGADASDTIDVSSMWLTKKLVLHGGLVMTVSSWYPDDKRDWHSYYVCSTSEASKYLEVEFVGDHLYEPYGSFKLKISKVNSHSDVAMEVEGWYLSVLDDKASDMKFRGYSRLVAHPEVERATTWYLQRVDTTTSWITDAYLRVKDAPWQPHLKDQFLSIPPFSERDANTNYLAVGPESSWETTVTLE